MAIADETIHEVDFCGVIATAANHYFESHRDSMPFLDARLEGKGRARKRKDLRFYDKHGKMLLTGEVKLPGGPGAFDDKVVKDAQDKADDAGVQYFFTWDVNTFVLWDRSQWDKPMLERRVRAWPLRLRVASKQELARREVLDFIKQRFLPDLLRDLGEIISGRRVDWAQDPDVENAMKNDIDDYIFDVVRGEHNVPISPEAIDALIDRLLMVARRQAA